MPDEEREVPTPRVDVETLANVFAPEKYGMLPVTADDEVERPLNPTVAPERVIGQAVEMVACLLFSVVCKSVPFSESIPM